MKKKYQFLAIIIAFTIIGSCKKIIDVGAPQNQLATQIVFSDTTSAQSALLNIYALFSNTVEGSYDPNISMYSDELNYSTATTQSLEFLHSTVSTTNSTDLTIWKNFYFIIYSCNDLINGLSGNKQIPVATENQFIAEAKFLRAYAYFHLTNLYGAVPLLVTTDVNVTAIAPNVDSTKIYNQVVADLTDAQRLLTPNYPGGGRIRANQYSTSALLARVYLYQRNWVASEAAATLVLNSGLYTPLTPPMSTFSSTSNETIFQFQTQSGFIPSTTTYIPVSGKPQYPLTSVLLSAFEPGDLRMINWIKPTTVSNVVYYYPYKYHNRTSNTANPESLIAFRSAETYLIRAEARLMQNNLTGAQEDLNVVRMRAGLPNTTAQTKSALIGAILHERQVELFTELGHRFFDLKRNGLANSVIGAYKLTWKGDTSLVLPIPQNDITRDPNLKQNKGY